MIKKIFIYVIFIIATLSLVTPGFFILEKTPISQSTINPTPNKKFITYYINLDRSTKRKKEIEKQIKHLSTEKNRTSAVDARNIENYDLERIVDFDNLNRYSFRADDESIHSGTIACMLSHKKTWSEFLRSDYEYAFILEDDAVLDHKQINSILKQLPLYKDSWDIAKFSIEGYTNAIKLFEIDGIDFLIPLNHTDSAAAYVINRKAADQLLNYSYKLKMPSDYHIERNWELGLKLVIASPNLVHQKYNHLDESTIGMSKRIPNKKINKNSLYIKYFRPVEYFMYNIKSQIAMVFHGFYTYLKIKLSNLVS